MTEFIMKTLTITRWVALGGLIPLLSTQAATISLTGTVRDFLVSHPDFEDYSGSDPGIVSPTLGLDGKPVYAGLAGNPTTTGAAYFDQWYRDVAGVNLATSHSITLTETAPGSGVYAYDDSAFFPIDGALWGNEGNAHNYHFTFELHTSFTYALGQTFSFRGDDDVWVFINKSLVVDLGGVHGPLSSSVLLDTLGLTAGNTYDLDFFFAERHTVGSNFKMETSIPLVSVVPESQPLWLYFAIGLVGLAGWRRFELARR